MNKKLLSAKNDFVFKMIFGDYKNIDILADFLLSVLDMPGDEYDKIEIIDPHLRKEWGGDKLGILDVKLHTKSKKVIDIEIQVAETPALRERVVFYTSKMITEQIGSGDDYGVIKRAVSIIITDFKLIKENEIYHNRYFLYDKDTGSRFTDIIEINTLELGKIPKESDKTQLWNWLKFLNSDGEEELSMITEENVMIKKAVGKLKELSEDERTRLLYEEREKARRDFESGLKGAFRKGKEEGWVEGEIEGKIKGGIETLILDNLEENIPPERILQKLQKRFNLSEEKARDQIQKYVN